METPDINRQVSNKAILVLMILAISFGPSFGQVDAEGFYSQSLRINNAGMYVLGSWAVANIATGAFGWAGKTGQGRYFNQMNLFWNVVNLSIAGFALYNNHQFDYSMLDSGALLQKHLQTEKLFLINAGLDIGYMGAGLLMKHLSNSSQKQPFLLKGYGNSVLLQGAFLFVFDLVMYGLSRAHRMNNIDMPGF